MLTAESISLGQSNGIPCTCKQTLLTQESGEKELIVQEETRLFLAILLF